jgi:hypothetical protein
MVVGHVASVRANGKVPCGTHLLTCWVGKMFGLYEV